MLIFHPPLIRNRSIGVPHIQTFMNKFITAWSTIGNIARLNGGISHYVITNDFSHNLVLPCAPKAMEVLI